VSDPVDIEKPQDEDLGAPACPYCGKPKTTGWTDAQVRAGKRFVEATNTLEYHCYERYVDD
jgi:hypothetical protein